MTFYRGAPLPYECSYCGADFCNQFALINHLKRCQAYNGKTEPGELK